jgi:hypothetical protein
LENPPKWGTFKTIATENCLTLSKIIFSNLMQVQSTAHRPRSAGQFPKRLGGVDLSAIELAGEFASLLDLGYWMRASSLE